MCTDRPEYAYLPSDSLAMNVRRYAEFLEDTAEKYYHPANAQTRQIARRLHAILHLDAEATCTCGPGDWNSVTGQPEEGRSCPCGTTWTAPVDGCPSCGPGGDRDRTKTDPDTGALNPDTQELDITSVLLETRLREASESVKSTADLLALCRSARPAGLSPR